MKALIVMLLTVYPFIAASAQDADRVKELEQRVVRLEERIARLEERMAKTESNGTNVQQTAEAKKMMKVARQHFESERAKYKPEDIAKAEEMYGKASRMLAVNESKTLLDSVVLLYPQLNRAGCAQLYRAQQETGQEQERLLKDCMERFSECYYGDGAQVGPFAMFKLAFYYRQSGKEREARDLFKRLRKESPEAVGHDGQLLVNYID